MWRESKGQITVSWFAVIRKGNDIYTAPRRGVRSCSNWGNQPMAEFKFASSPATHHPLEDLHCWIFTRWSLTPCLPRINTPLKRLCQPIPRPSDPCRTITKSRQNTKWTRRRSPKIDRIATYPPRKAKMFRTNRRPRQVQTQIKPMAICTRLEVCT